ncbi:MULTISPECIES: phage holin family protein [Nonlabens]|uniref:Uncharacterized protein n=1 Tax=Nonlabens ulvanivorans TaxID=906888 RepID=A0A090Q6B9_NONUL|nr:phage holin family protein [Nonlabens ulvanivorans]WOI22364.1 phage holin family protein [Nonlabens ulvanivorans]GAK98634.1 hypothetical protein JCM19314_2665 [Nonlabens ulvanivorans]GAL73932.1 hypothetical protein JCM19275_2779 [Nonlabens ulvanivorans]
MGKGISENIQEFTTATQSFIESSINYHKLDLYKKVMSGVISSSHKLLLGFFLLISILFLSLAASIYIGDLLDNDALGYLIVGLFYFLLVILVALFMKPVIEKSLLRKTSQQFFNSNEDIKIDKYESL